ncbi:hypothetical protein PAXINDRAFT_14447 [Paxillus involutus ATCC 200175]|uniref:Uncharacterized protein n=1 Tax=Paxillus involutus ATCC 200175 TaxID=664439 RepID=A0A0C9TYU0_PAXIN|nr:hypothetical protein PAXINDRAFT_14447 [Paxillus involutus ATCC 200175]
MNMESQYLTSESQESTVSWAPDIQSLILRLIRPKCAGPSYNEPTDPGFNYTIPSGNPNVGTYDCDSQDLDDTRCSATLPPALPPWAPRQQFIQPSALDTIEKTELINKATTAAFLKLHQHHYLRVRVNANNMWEVLCPVPDCDTWVKTGIKNHISLALPGHFTNLEAHICAQSCGKSKPRKTMQTSCTTVAAVFPKPPPFSLPLSAFNPSQMPLVSDTSSSESTLTSDTTLLAPMRAHTLLPCPSLILDECNWPVNLDTPAEANFPWLHCHKGLDEPSIQGRAF